MWKYGIALALGIALITGTYITGRNAGTAAAELEYAQALADERNRQDQANVEANRRAAERIRELEAGRALDALLLVDLAARAARDPNAGTCGLTIDGVLRHNGLFAPPAP